MDPYAFIGQSLADGFYRGQERRDKKKTIEEEYAQRMRMLQEQHRLEAAAPTAEMKNMEMFNANPDRYMAFRKAMDPMAGPEMALKQAQWNAQFGLQQQNAADERAYRQWQMQKPQITPMQQNFQFLMGMPGMTQEKALQYLMRPDMMTQFMGAMMGGGGAPGGAGGGIPDMSR